MARPRVLLADDHTLVLEAFTRLLAAEFDVVGTVSDTADLLAITPKVNPDVIVLDIGMPGITGMMVGQQLKKLLPKMKFVALTMNGDPEIAREAIRTWASAYVLKRAGSNELIHAIWEALSGRSFITSSVAQQLEDDFIRDPRSEHRRQLTARQREVLQLLAEGRTMREVADRLHVRTRTVAFHKYRIMEEFGLKTSSDLVRFAIRERVISASL